MPSRADKSRSRLPPSIRETSAHQSPAACRSRFPRPPTSAVPCAPSVSRPPPRRMLLLLPIPHIFPAAALSRCSSISPASRLLCAAACNYTKYYFLIPRSSPSTADRNCLPCSANSVTRSVVLSRHRLQGMGAGVGRWAAGVVGRRATPPTRCSAVQLPT